MFTVLSEENVKIDNAEIWLDGHSYKADANGDITGLSLYDYGRICMLTRRIESVPFTNSPKTQTILLSNGDFTVLSSFRHQVRFSLFNSISIYLLI